MINHPGFVTLASTFSGPRVCSAPPHHQARSRGTAVLPRARAARMLATQEGSSRHISLCPRTPRSLLFQPQEPKIPFPSAIFACPGLAVLLGGTGCCPTPRQVWGNGLGPRQGPTLPGWGLKGFSQACPCFCMSFYKLLSIVPGLSKVLKSPQIPFFIVTHGNGGIHARQWRDLSFSFKVRHAKQSDVLTPHQESAPDLAFLCKLSSRLTANESLLLRGHINPLISLEQRGKIRISFREGNQNMMNSESSAALWEKNDSSCSQTEVCTCEGESGLVETNEEESSWTRPERVTQMGKTGSKKNFLHLVSVS